MVTNFHGNLLPWNFDDLAIKASVSMPSGPPVAANADRRKWTTAHRGLSLIVDDYMARQRLYWPIHALLASIIIVLGLNLRPAKIAFSTLPFCASLSIVHKQSFYWLYIRIPKPL
jgi:hypothetical protein